MQSTESKLHEPHSPRIHTEFSSAGFKAAGLPAAHRLEYGIHLIPVVVGLVVASEGLVGAWDCRPSGELGYNSYQLSFRRANFSSKLADYCKNLNNWTVCYVSMNMAGYVSRAISWKIVQ